MLIANCDKQELYDDINKKREDYKISYDYYMEQSNEEGIGAMHEKYVKIANFYNLCMLYADKNMSGLLDENTSPEDEEDTEYEEEDIWLSFGINTPFSFQNSGGSSGYIYPDEISALYGCGYRYIWFFIYIIQNRNMII